MTYNAGKLVVVVVNVQIESKTDKLPDSVMIDVELADGETMMFSGIDERVN